MWWYVFTDLDFVASIMIWANCTPSNRLVGWMIHLWILMQVNLWDIFSQFTLIAWSFTLAFYNSMHPRKGRPDSYKTTCTINTDSHWHICLLPLLLILEDSCVAHGSRATEPQRPGRPWPPHFLGQFFFFSTMQLVISSCVFFYINYCLG